MKKTKTIITILLAVILLFAINPMARATINPGDFDPSSHGPSQEDVDKIAALANPVIGTIKIVGIVIAVITLAILGVKYMTGSVSEKAEYKKTMIPYIIGAVLVVALTQFLGVIIAIVTNVE